MRWLIFLIIWFITMNIGATIWTKYVYGVMYTCTDALPGLDFFWKPGQWVHQGSNDRFFGTANELGVDLVRYSMISASVVIAVTTATTPKFVWPRMHLSDILTLVLTYACTLLLCRGAIAYDLI